jgi:hypothetical protein
MIVCRERDRVGEGKSVKWTWSSSNSNNISNINNASSIKINMSNIKGGQRAKWQRGKGQIAAMQRGMHAKSQRASIKGEVFREGRGQRLKEAESGEVDWIVKRR